MKVKLNQFQKKYLKKNLRKIPLSQISQNLSIPEKDIREYLSSIWSKEKFQRFIFRSEDEKESRTDTKKPFNFAGWIKDNWKVLLFLSILSFGVYINSLGNDFLSDDIPMIRDNPIIRKIDVKSDLGLWLLYFRAFTVTLTYKLFGLNPLFFRLPNLIFHTGTTLLSFIVLRQFFKSPIPFFVASIFAVHPILTEAVTWISGAPYSNSAFFMLLSFLLYLKFSKNSLKYWLSLLSFYFALSISQKAVSFPLILIAYEFCLGDFKRNWKKIIPFLALGLFWGIYLGTLLQGRVSSLKESFYQEGKFYNPLTQIPTAISFYLKLIFWPRDLTFYHSEMFFSKLRYLIMALVTLAFFTSIILTFLKRQYRLYCFWLCFFIITLLPVLTPFKIAWIVAERYVYLGTLGILLFVGMAIQKIGEMTKNKLVSYSILAIILILFSIKTISRNVEWKNQDNLWLATGKTSPSSPQNHNNLGDYYGRYGNYEKAIEEFQTAIKLLPGYADAYHNMANIYKLQGKDEPALENYLEAISFNPNIWQSHFNVALIYSNRRQYSDALSALEKAVILNPNNQDIHFALAVVNHELGNKEKAIEELQIMLKIDPNNAAAKSALQQLSQTKENE